VQRGRHIRGTRSGDQGQELPPQSPPQHRGSLQYIPVSGIKRRQPASDELRERPRHPNPQRAERRPTLTVTSNRPGLDQTGEQLLHQQWQPVRRRNKEFFDLGPDRRPSTSPRQLAHIPCGQRRQSHHPHIGVTHQHPQPAGLGLVAARGTQHPHRRPPQRRGQILQQRQRVPIGPLQIVEQHHAASPLRDHLEEFQDGLTEHDHRVHHMRARSQPDRPSRQNPRQHRPIRREPIVSRQIR